MSQMDLHFFELDRPLDWSRFRPKPTACLVVLNVAISYSLLESLVRGAANAGCIHFMTWGQMADEVHDSIDEILEDGSDDWLRILTTSHLGEAGEDVSAFLFHATLPGKLEARYLVIGDRPVEELQQEIAVPED